MFFNSEFALQIGLPDCESFSVSAKQIALTKHVLNNIKRGLIIFYDKGCFYTRRLCQSRVCSNFGFAVVYPFFSD